MNGMKLLKQEDRFSNKDKGIINEHVSMTPAVGKDDYWLYRVDLSPEQSIIGFPKFDTIGIGFLREAYSWNTNLPFDCEAEKIYEYIKRNKGSENIIDGDCIRAIEMIQDAIKEDYVIEYRKFGNRIVGDLKGLKDKRSSKDHKSLVVFTLKDMLDYFSKKDRDWLQVDEKNATVLQSREGWEYEPHFAGKIVEMDIDIPDASDVDVSLTTCSRCNGDGTVDGKPCYGCDDGGMVFDLVHARDYLEKLKEN
jgi:hypothetical protein